MEKIYMEDNNYNNQKQSQKGKYHFSIVLSFIVAVMAIASLVVVGFDQISYAAVTPVEGDEFTFYRETDDKPIRIVADGDGFTVPEFRANSADGPRLFCIEHKQDPGRGETYKKAEEIEDAGLLYILNKSAVYGGEGIVSKSLIGKNGLTQEKYDYLETYVTQVSVWLYLVEKNGNTGKHEISENGLTSIKNATSYVVYKGGNSDDNKISEITAQNIFGETPGTNTVYKKYINELVKKALDPKINVKEVNVTFKDGKDISEVKDSDYYQTGAISVSVPSNDLKNYTVSLNGVDGAFVVNSNGEKVESFGPTDVFYIRIPKDKVSETAKTLNITVNGTFDNFLQGTAYVGKNNADLQKVVTVKNISKTVPGNEQISIVGAPDTGMSKAQTVYFIGLIVLLCGVGIIYASSKPIKEN